MNISDRDGETAKGHHMETLTILGGGSAYAPGLLQALIAHAPELPLKTVRLYDIDATRLAIVGRLTAAMASNAGTFKVEVVDSLEAAIEGADLILNSTRPGGLAARRIDETLPLEFAIPGQETVGPGGFFYALRSVPEALRVAAIVERLAPRAIILNYTNPSNIVTQALFDRGGVQVIGMCDQSDEDLQALAHALGRSMNYAFRCNGLNHATWYSDVLIDGVALPDLAAALVAPDEYDDEHKLRFGYSLDLARANAGYWPNSYLPYYLYPAAFVEQALRVGPRSDAVAASLPAYYAHFEEEGQRAVPDLRMYRGSAGFGDLAVTVIRALSSSTPHELVLNLPNQGATSAFKDDTVIETRVRVSRAGIERLPAPPLPASFDQLAAQLERYQRLTARAAIATSAENDAALVAALAANPLVGNESLAARMLARARVSYGGLLPATP
ncbi:MAG: 6-phospho-beta-glucosidase [Janthinobacterium sp.]|jgi:6-phospho-beta-glucosidase